jgi:hypothetical protein
VSDLGLVPLLAAMLLMISGQARPALTAVTIPLRKVKITIGRVKITKLFDPPGD